MDTGHFVCENFCQNCVFLAQLLGAQLCQADVKSKISKEDSPYGLLYININQWDIFHFGIYIFVSSIIQVNIMTPVMDDHSRILTWSSIILTRKLGHLLIYVCIIHNMNHHYINQFWYNEVL